MKLVTVLISLIAVGCANGFKGNEHSLGNPVYYAKANIYGLKSKRSLGTIKFSEAFGKLKLIGNVESLLGGQDHGISIYEFGDCQNTGKRYRGMDNINAKAMGRLGNIKANSLGEAKIEMEVEKLSINTGRYPIVGRSIVIHQHKDDMVSKGHGGTGSKIACGVIGAASQ